MSKLFNVLRAMDAITAQAPAEAQPDSVPEPDEYGYWTRRPDGGLHYHAYDPATEDDEDEPQCAIAECHAWPVTTCACCGRDVCADDIAGETSFEPGVCTDCIFDCQYTLACQVVQQPAAPVTCHRCGEAVGADALDVQTGKDGPKLGAFYCATCLIAGSERLRAAIREQRESGGAR